jgi:hypothetical protein
MSDKQTFNEKHSQHQCYEIRLKGHLDDQWSEWFEGLTITLEEDGDTLLIGPVVDQAALHGLLKKVRDLGMSLVSVNFVNPGRAKLRRSNRKPYLALYSKEMNQYQLKRRKK